jgi:hypothetical protein
MIQDVELVGDGDVGHLQVVERSGDVAVGHVPARVIVGPNDSDAGMLTARRLNQEVQVAEVVVGSWRPTPNSAAPRTTGAADPKFCAVSEHRDRQPLSVRGRAGRVATAPPAAFRNDRPSASPLGRRPPPIWSPLAIPGGRRRSETPDCRPGGPDGYTPSQKEISIFVRLEISFCCGRSSPIRAHL